MSRSDKYHAGITRGAALLQETHLIFQELSKSDNVQDVRHSVTENNLLAKKTHGRIRSIWHNIHQRYFEGKSIDEIRLLTRAVTSDLPKSGRDLILFYEFSMSDCLVYDLTVECLFALYQEGRSLITKKDLRLWLTNEEKFHPEITDWTPQTIERIIRHYLAIAKDFGLLEGRQSKSFSRLFIPIFPYLWGLYRHKEQGLSTKAIIQSQDFRLFLLDERDVVLLANEAAREGYIHFQSAGNIYNLDFIYPSFNEVLDGLEAKV